MGVTPVFHGGKIILYQICISEQNYLVGAIVPTPLTYIRH